MSIVVFSQNYASSRWCLDELAKILECRRTNGQTVHPVFYDVDPSDVRHQLGSFAEAIEKHKKRFMDKEIEIWCDALTEASNLSGYDLKNDANGHESKLIQQIVKKVVQEVKPKAFIVDEYLVGMDSHVEDLYGKISIGSSNLRVVGIHGMGGVGKTTIAKAFYNKYFHRFECSCFLENVSEASQKHDGPLSLVQQLTSELLEKQDFTTVNGGISYLKERVSTKKVLIVLDDLDQSSQSKLLVRYWNFFGPESRIIITTRDKRMLDEFKKIDEGYMVMPYMVETLAKNKSLKLFSHHAFGGTILEDFREISEWIVSYTGGLPLALKVLGSFLFRRTMEEWTSTLEKLQQIPNNEIQTILKMSYDKLDFKEKEIFLDIASFLVGMHKEEANGFFPHIGIKILEERCLLTIDQKNKFRMHDLIRDMGREIVRGESKEPGERSRLWCQEEVCHVLRKQKGTKKIEGIMLDLTTSGPEYFNAKTFESMPNLRLLHISNVHLTGSFENSFEELRWLRWSSCPLKCLPPSFHAPKLVSLDMQQSQVSTLWEGTKHLKSLKFLNASHSHNLTTTPDFGGVKMLEKLSLSYCSSLVRVHPSIGLLKSLVHLDLSCCNKLKRLQIPDSIGHMARLVKLNLFNFRSHRSLPSSICNLISLEELDLNHCDKLVGLPAELGNMKSLQRLNASDCGNLRNLPNSICNLSSLEKLDLSRCSELVGLPAELGNIKSLKRLDARFCENLRNLPNSICNLSSLEELDLSYCSELVGLPAELGNIKSLKRLDASGCKNLRNVPNSICNLSSLEVLDLSGCYQLVGLPAELGNIKSLKRLNASGCKNLRNVPNSICNLSSLEHLNLSFCYQLVGLSAELGNINVVLFTTFLISMLDL